MTSCMWWRRDISLPENYNETVGGTNRIIIYMASHANHPFSLLTFSSPPVQFSFLQSKAQILFTKVYLISARDDLVDGV